jgi:hypothetical protein
MIGKGGYGEVWMARTIADGMRAVKIVRRARFSDSRPYERELNAIKNYETLSRGHPALLKILHVGTGEDYYYYVMPLADPVDTTAEEAKYTPRTLSTMLSEGSSLSLAESILIAKRLLDGLRTLHNAGLVHRDIKPSNVVFIRGQAVLADIGLVTASASDVSYVGTEGYIPPEKPGMPSGDIYAMGVLLYCMVTGMSCTDCPSPPSGLCQKDQESFARINPVILRACDVDPEKRYPNAESMIAALERLLDNANAVPAETHAEPPEPEKITAKKQLKHLIRKTVDETVAKCRMGRPHDQQYLSVPDIRWVTTAVRDCVRLCLQRLPQEVALACKHAEAILEPNSAKRRKLLDIAFGHDATNIEPNKATPRRSAFFRACGGLPRRIVKGCRYLAGRTSTAWYDTYYARLQRDPDIATRVALRTLLMAIDGAIEDNWPRYKDDLGLKTKAKQLKTKRKKKST